MSIVHLFLITEHILVKKLDWTETSFLNAILPLLTVYYDDINGKIIMLNSINYLTHS